jgi:hypothetical protein
MIFAPIVTLLTLSCAYHSNMGHMVKKGAVRSWLKTPRQMVHLSARKDFIDVDVVNRNGDSDSSRKSIANGDGPGMERREAQADSGDGRGLLGGIVKTVGSGLSKLFGQDEESKKKAARKAELNKGIDRIFDEAGLGGGLFRAAAKGIGAMVTDIVSDLNEDIDLVQDALLVELERDSKARFTLGSNINVGMPFQSNSYTSNINGVQTKTVQYIMPVAGSKAQAQAEVSARLSNGELMLESLSISSLAGRIVVIAPGGRGGGGSGSGGGAGDVIDVEVL